MGCALDEEISRSKGDKEIATARARQAHYIKWAQLKQIPDPCGPEDGYQRVVAIYGEYVKNGANCTNKEATRSKTLEGYFNAVNFLFESRSCPPPVDFGNPANPGYIILKNLEAEEDIARRRSPLTTAMYAEIIRRGKDAARGTEPWIISKLTSLAKIVGPRACEFAQKTQTKIEIHKYPSGRKTEVKAWTRADFAFRDKNGGILDPTLPSTRKLVAKVTIRWRIQKNRQNGQLLTIVRDWDNEDFCAVLAALDLVLHSIEIGQKAGEPILAVVPPNKPKQYVTANKVAAALQSVAKKVHPDFPSDEIKK